MYPICRLELSNNRTDNRDLCEGELAQHVTSSYHDVNIPFSLCMCVCAAEEEAGLRGEGGEDAAGSGSAPGGL